MRTTLNTVYNKIQNNLGRINSELVEANERISTGQQMSKITDNPINLVSALRFRSSIVELNQYEENIQHGDTIITAAEAALTQMKDLAIRAKTLTIQATDPGLTSSNLTAISEEIKNLFAQSIQLANTQINGKYIFGGFRTTGYDSEEPAPFIADKGDGHWINGTTPNALSDALITGSIPTTLPLTDIASGDLQINGTDIGLIALSGSVLSDGLNMAGADIAKTAINLQSGTTNVTAYTTTLYSSGTAATDDTTVDLADADYSFDLNGTTISVSIPDGTPAGGANGVADLFVQAINSSSDETGVIAVVGDAANGGIANSIVFKNRIKGDESAIEVTNYTGPTPSVAGDSSSGFGNFGPITADATHNTGEISLSSSETYVLSSPNNTTDDTILNALGLGGGNVSGSFVDDANDGTLVSGYRLDTNDLLINGLAVPPPSSDGISTIFTDASAAAKATAINTLTTQTGVTAEVIPIAYTAPASVEAGTESSRLTGTVTNTEILANTIAINGTLISTQIAGGAITNGLNMEKAFNSKNEINTLTATTNVSARLTTKYSGIAAGAPGATAVSFTLNGTSISVTTGGVSAAKTAEDVVAAINAASSTTGVEAKVGDGTNGGPSNAIVLNNVVRGNENDIVLADIDAAPTDETFIGIANGTWTVGSTRNTGQISLESDYPIILTSPSVSPSADTIINELGFSSATAVGVGAGSSLTATMSVNGPISAGPPAELAVNGHPILNDITTAGATLGIFMDKAFSAKTEIELADPNVQVKLTTMTSDVAAAGSGPGGIAANDSDISFSLNGELVTVTYSAGATPGAMAQAAADAINLISSKTGVQAFVGDGATNGGPANAIVFKNTTIGDDSAITVSDLTVNAGNNDLGFSNFTQTADINNNSGQITINSLNTFDLSSPPNSAVIGDTILAQFGLDGGGKGYSDLAADGIIYGSKGTGNGEVSYGATPRYLDSGDLIINGVDIFTTPTAILNNDSNYALMEGINAKTAQTGIQATKGLDGKIILSASDGRNMYIQTSTLGENTTHLNGGSQDKVYFGSIQLRSDRQFSLQTPLGPTPNLYEQGLAAIGMSGGAAITGEPTDIANDGKIDVFSIHDQLDAVRYAGDRENDLTIKISKTGTMAVGENGKTGVMDTTIFSTLQSLANFLENKNFTTVTGIHTATDTSKTLNSKSTGLEPEDQLPTENLFQAGNFTVIVKDHDYSPARDSAVTIEINPSTDTLDSVAKRLDGIPNISASWATDGHLKIESTDASRYTIELAFDSSNFLEATGVSSEFIQRQALSQSLANLDTLMDNLTNQISDFGARANRIGVQTEIYSNMLISTKDNLSEVQDTDIIEAIMNLKSKEVAYQAALSAASKTMQLSLVDFL